MNKVLSISNARLESAQFSEALTAYLAGVTPTAAEGLLGFLAPAVKVGRRFEYRKIGKGAFATETESDLVRPIGGEFKRLEFAGDIVSAKTLNKGLTVILDKDEIVEGDEERYVEWLRQRIMRASAATAVAMLQSIASSATSSAWTGGSAKAPDAELLKCLQAVLTASGAPANRLLIGVTAWANRLAYYEGANSVNNAAANLTLEQLAQKLAIERVMVPQVLADTGSGKAHIASASEVIAFIGTDSAMQEDASAIKRFWSPAGNGGEWGVYREEKAKTVALTVECYSLIAQTVAGAAKRLAVS